MPRVLIADRHPVASAGLRAILERRPRLRVIPPVDRVSAVEAIAAGPSPPDLIVTDLHLRDGSALGLIQRLSVVRPDIAVMATTVFDDWFWVERSLQAGARAVVLKTESDEAFVQAVETVLAGGVFVSPAFSRRSVPAAIPGTRRPEVLEACLTDREMEVFVLVGRGMDRGEIARHLHLSPRTIDRHTGRIRTKGGFEDAVALLRYAMLWTSYRPPTL